MLGRLIITVSLLVVPMFSHAGHLFTQAALNTPVDLTAGQGIDLPQNTMEPAAPTSDHLIYVQNFDSGDILRLIVGGTTRDFNFDSMPTGYTASSSVISTITNAQTDDPGLLAENLALPFTFRIQAIAGAFTLEGFRIRITNGTINGTGTGTVNQTLVTANVIAPEDVPALSLAQILALVFAMVVAGGLVFVRRSHLEKVPAA